MSQGFTKSEVADMLAQTVGEEKARQVVDAAAQELGLTSPSISQSEAKLLLGKISEQPGIVGMAATFAKSRMHFTAAADSLRSFGD